MGTTTFSGPIKAGSIKDTTGTTVGSDIANVGSVVMAQSEEVNQVATTDTTNIVIPANSQIVNISLVCSTAWDATETVKVGDTTDVDQYTTTLTAPGIGNNQMAPSTAAMAGNWKDIGSTDSRIVVTNSATGSGVGVLTVQYIQNNNLS